MYRISFISKRSTVDIHSRGRGITAQLQTLFTSLRGLVGGGFSGKIENGSPADKAMRQALSAINHAAGHIIEGGKIRTVCAPDDRLKAMQRRVLRALEHLPMHNAAHGFIIGRDPVTCASAHTNYWGGRPNSLVILNMDAKNFFPSITSQVVRKALEANHVRPVDIEAAVSTCMCRADEIMALAIIDGLVRLGGNDTQLCNLALPIIGAFTRGAGVVMPNGAAKRLAFALCKGFLSLGPSVSMVNKFLPQGAPTSPLLSNLAMKLVDVRLSAMAASFGGFYTRYADDLTVSWLTPTKGKVIDGMYRCAELVLAEYGVAMNRDKKRVMGHGTRQDIVGLCVNSGTPTISRQKRMRIRAIVHNEAVRGSQNFRNNKRQPGKFERYSSVRPDPKRVAYIMGNIGHVGSVHPREASRYGVVLRSVMNPASVRNLSELHPEDVFHEINTEQTMGGGSLLPHFHSE